MYGRPPPSPVIRSAPRSRIPVESTVHADEPLGQLFTPSEPVLHGTIKPTTTKKKKKKKKRTMY
jgi:hypothetical protein